MESVENVKSDYIDYILITPSVDSFLTKVIMYTGYFFNAKKCDYMITCIHTVLRITKICNQNVITILKLLTKEVDGWCNH